MKARHCIALCLVVLAAGCSSKAKLKLTESAIEPAYTQKPASSIAVMAWYGDDEFEIRSMVENAFIRQWQAQGIAAAGYRFFDRYTGLTENVEAAAAKLRSAGIDTVVFIDPLRARAYDPGAAATRRSAYPALGMDTAATFGAIGALIEEADAAKFVMEVTVWSPESKTFGWR